MLEIVAKRDSLIALLEEERQRWCKLSCLIHILLLQMHIFVHIFIFSHKSEYLSYIFKLSTILFVYIFFNSHSGNIN